jgi:hypothetical protein
MIKLQLTPEVSVIELRCSFTEHFRYIYFRINNNKIKNTEKLSNLLVSNSPSIFEFAEDINIKDFEKNLSKLLEKDVELFYQKTSKKVVAIQFSESEKNMTLKEANGYAQSNGADNLSDWINQHINSKIKGIEDNIAKSDENIEELTKEVDKNALKKATPEEKKKMEELKAELKAKKNSENKFVEEEKRDAYKVNDISFDDAKLKAEKIKYHLDEQLKNSSIDLNIFANLVKDLKNEYTTIDNEGGDFLYVQELKSYLTSVEYILETTRINVDRANKIKSSIKGKNLSLAPKEYYRIDSIKRDIIENISKYFEKLEIPKTITIQADIESSLFREIARQVKYDVYKQHLSKFKESQLIKKNIKSRLLNHIENNSTYQDLEIDYLSNNIIKLQLEHYSSESDTIILKYKFYDFIFYRKCGVNLKNQMEVFTNVIKNQCEDAQSDDPENRVYFTWPTNKEDYKYNYSESWWWNSDKPLLLFKIILDVNIDWYEEHRTEPLEPERPDTDYLWLEDEDDDEDDDDEDDDDEDDDEDEYKEKLAEYNKRYNRWRYFTSEISKFKEFYELYESLRK